MHRLAYCVSQELVFGDDHDQQQDAGEENIRILDLHHMSRKPTMLCRAVDTCHSFARLSRKITNKLAQKQVL